MSGLVDRALGLWGMDGADHRLFAARENEVHQVRHAGATYALRVHRAGYRTDAELQSELEMMDAARRAGLHVPAPVVSASGALIHVVDGLQIDVLHWLEGTTIGKTGTPLSVPDTAALFTAIGREMARFHDAMDDWTPPARFTRCAWDHAGLLGDTPVWGRFWDNPTLDSADRALFQQLRMVAGRDLDARAPGLDYGLIHADLVRENVMVHGAQIQIIDFDDAGFGYRLFELATTLLKNMAEPDYARLKSALIDGYRAVRPMDTGALDLFLVLRAATYVGWIVERLDEDGAMMRNDRFIATTRALAEEYLSAKH
ncbi:phosphotransferase [Rhodobacter sp. NTK016B]|uniref:phosphotransferase enzyme family protein n=2 Tax=Bacteria TaxID=2 RepID=UPI001A8E8895|nr:phosphotransferase [Rhodobacter sp. NTK016B]MBN8294842.1 phosphotransferase [Rhodobacter sp. NTK016B]